MVSWEPVKRLRVRLAMGLGVSKMKRSSEEEARLDEDAERKRLALIGAMEGARAKWSHIGFIQDVGGCCGSASRRDAHVNDKRQTRQTRQGNARSCPRDRISFLF